MAVEWSNAPLARRRPKAALHSVDAAVSLPYFRQIDEREIPTSTWRERFRASDEDGMKLAYPATAALSTLPAAARLAAASPDAATGEPEAVAAREAAAVAPGGGGGGVDVTIEGRWAYVPILDAPSPIDPARPRGGLKYTGFSLPVMLVEPAEGGEENGEDGSSLVIGVREHELSHQLPPIVADHHHGDIDGAPGSLHQHHHDGRAHRHRK